MSKQVELLPRSVVTKSGSEDVISLTLRLPKSEYLQLQQAAYQYKLPVEEFVLRRSLGRRMPRFIGDVLSRICHTLNLIESQLSELNRNLYIHGGLDDNARLSLKQLSSLVLVLKRQMDF
jgi:hypothetical protein